MLRLAIVCGAAAGALLAPTAAQAAPAGLPPVERALTASKTAAGDCAGIARTTWTAPMSGFVSVRLSAKRGDWDLSLVDARTRRALATSQGFGARELAQTWVHSGQRISVRGCRERGARAARVSIRFLDVKPPDATTPALVRIKRPNEHLLHWLEEEGFDVTHSMRQDYSDVIAPDASKLSILEKANVAFDVRERDLNAYYVKSRRADAAYAARVGDSPLPTGRTGYRQYADYQEELKQIADPAGPYKDIARPVVIGHSFQGREIQGVELSDRVAADDDGKPTFFLVGLHHAREWPSAEIALEYAWMLAKGHGADPKITELLKRERVVIVPIINPDGFFASRAAASDGMFPDPADETGIPEGDTVEGVAVPFGGNLAYRRKNCNGPVPSLGGAERDYPCYYQWGVDPNRNYGEGWGGPGASPDPNTQVFRGEGQWSEPETQAVHEYSQSNPVTTIVSLHNVAALVLRPPGRRADGKAPDEFLLKELGDAMASKTGYTSQYGFELYDTSGTTEDWNYAAAGSLGYTIEIGPVNGQFHMPYETGVVEEWQGPPVDDANPDGPRRGGMREALMLAAQSAAEPKNHSVLSGDAAPGRVLRVKKSFETKSSPVCTFAQGYVRAGTVPALDCIAPGSTRSTPDGLEYTTKTPRKGDFEWHITPSTRPFVGGRFVEGDAVNRNETFTGAGAGQPPARGQAVEHQFTVTEDDFARNLDLKLDWLAKPEDYNLNLYFVQPDGSRVGIGTAWIIDGALLWTAPGRGQNPNGVAEHITLTNPPVGTYVAEVVNVNGVVNDWTLTVARSGQKPGHTEPTGVTEAWTLTCEDESGTVLEQREVTVARGQRLSLGKFCAKKKGK